MHIEVNRKMHKQNENFKRHKIFKKYPTKIIELKNTISELKK